MAYNTFPTLAGIGWPVVVTPKWKTSRQQSASGAQFNLSLMSSPLHDIEAPINYLSAADETTLRAFFNGQQGGAIPFYFVPTNGSTYLVTFATDTQDFTQFMSQMYQAGKIKMTEFR